MQGMRVAGAQVYNHVGDLEANVRRIAEAMDWAEGQGADVLVLPELALTGYPPEDLVLHHEFVRDAEKALWELARRSDQMTTVLSTVDRVPPQRSWDTRERDIAIAAKLLSGREVRGTYHKCLLPTYGVYDEGRNIAPGRRADALWLIGDAVAGVVICEDMWSGDGPPERQSAAGARILLVPNASPYHRGKREARLEFARSVARRNGVPLVYMNFHGGQDDIVFDGGSLAVDARGRLLHRCREFEADRFCLDIPLAPVRPVTGRLTTVHTRPLARRATPPSPIPDPAPDDVGQAWRAVVTGTRDFIVKNRFKGAVLGLSGGIDAAITAAVACEALGPDKVLGVAMPARSTPEDELNDARTLAANLGISMQLIPIDEVEEALASALNPRLEHQAGRETRRDFEAWARAAVLRGFADERNMLILTTVNKSELAIGHTAQGDLTGHFAPLRDCPKTLLYEFGRLLNRENEMIPASILHKPTSAQSMEEETPPYHILDPVVERYLEQEARLEDLIAEGYQEEKVVWILRRIDDAEFLRRQMPLGVRITEKAFDQDRRMPISNAWRPYKPRDQTFDEGGSG